MVSNDFALRGAFQRRAFLIGPVSSGVIIRSEGNEDRQDDAPDEGVPKR